MGFFGIFLVVVDGFQDILGYSQCYRTVFSGYSQWFFQKSKILRWVFRAIPSFSIDWDWFPGTFPVFQGGFGDIPIDFGLFF